MRSGDLQRILALLLASLGVAVASGWLLHVPWLVQPIPGTVGMVLSTACSFFACGLALLLETPGARGLRRSVVTALGAGVLTWSALVLTQDWLGFRLDAPALHAWLADGNPNPGRMAPNTAFGFLCAGAALVSLARPAGRAAETLAGVLSFLVLLTGATGLAGYWLETDLLLSWTHVRMALPTGAAMLLLGSGLWCAWRDRATARSTESGAEAGAEGMMRTSAGILTAIVLVAGIAGFSIMEVQVTRSTDRALQTGFNSRLDLFAESLKNGVEASDSLALRQVLIEQTQLLASGSGQADRSRINGLFASARAGGFSALRVESNDGRLLASAGTLSDQANPRVALDAAGDVVLGWRSGYVLQLRKPIVDLAGNQVGVLRSERTLPALTARLTTAADFGNTGEVVVCAPQGPASMRCFPEQRRRVAFTVPRLTSRGQPLPMALALRGQHGLVYSTDYRGQHVVAVFAPMAGARLGMVFKQDSAEIYAPIRVRLYWLLLALALLVGLGLLLLFARVRPLARRLAESERLSRLAREELAAVVAGVADGMLTVDLHGRVIAANPAACRMFQYSPQAMTGMAIVELMPLRHRVAHLAGMTRFIATGQGRLVGAGAVQLAGLRSDGSEFPLELSIAQVEAPDGRQLVGTLRDVTVRHLAEQQVHFERERLRVTLHSIGDAVITTDTRGVISYMNPVAQALTGWTADDAVGLSNEKVFRIVHEVTDETAPNPIDFVLSTGSLGGLANDTVLVRRDGTRVAIEDSAAPIRDAADGIVGVVLVFHDVTQARQLAGQIGHQATHDALTELVNRRGFECQLGTLLAEARSDKGHVLLYIDLDQFKIVNDTCGHVAGDELLKLVASVLQGQLRRSDQLARLGGDEFAVVLRDCPQAVGLRIAEAMRTAVAGFRFAWRDKPFAIGASIGLVHFHCDETMGTLLSAADAACYLAKDKGRNRVYVHDRLDAEVLRQSGEFNWTSRLRAALDEGRFVLFAQPIVPLSARTPTQRHYELLLRMRDEQGELVPPMAFIPAAERYGLMPEIDRWVVSNALDELGALRAAGWENLLFSINLSGTTLADAAFGDFVAAEFARTDVPPTSVCFEVTESAAIANLSSATRLVNQVKALGCRFSLDDFGAGMSSFAYLKHLPVDFLKIDGSFVRDIATNAIDAAMVEAINSIGHVMGLSTIAEFVENDAAADALRRIGVDYGQGYGIGVPLGLHQVFAPAPAAATHAD